jgi:hypothetical protein
MGPQPGFAQHEYIGERAEVGLPAAMAQRRLEVLVVEQALLLPPRLDPAIVDDGLLRDEDGLPLEEGAERLRVRRLAALQQIEGENGFSPPVNGKDIAPYRTRMVAPKTRDGRLASMPVGPSSVRDPARTMVRRLGEETHANGRIRQ